VPVLVADELGLHPAWVPGSPGATLLTTGDRSTGGRVLVDDVLDYFGAWASSPLNADIVLTLTYDPALSRVRITATGMDVFTLATVERSTNQISWTTVRGGDTVSVAAGTLKLDDYEFAPNVLNYYRLRTLVPFGQSETADITPTLTAVWLKSVARPFLNLIISAQLGDTFRFERPDRGAAFDVVGRSLPVAVTDVRGSRRYVLWIRTDTDDAGTALDFLFASGDILFLHAPPGSVVPTGGVFLYAGRMVVDYPMPPDPMRFTSVPVVEVAAPGPDVVGATSSWQTVINTYATWADVIAAKASWSELLELVGDGSEVIVP
jgi:hypothetical protein